MKRGRSRLRIGAKVRMGGKTFRITRATAKGKKYKAVPLSGKGGLTTSGPKVTPWLQVLLKEIIIVRAHRG